MDELTLLANRPFAFIFKYVRHRAPSHAVIVAAVLAAVGCSITTQYGVKYLVDTLASRSQGVWVAFALLVGLIAADNILWRLAGWVATFSFVRVTSALDQESEDAVTAGLNDLMRGRTVIAIAHRHSTLRNFDRIIVLESGRVARYGPAHLLLDSYRIEPQTAA